MKNVNVLLAVVLCAGLCVLFGLFNRSADESLGWSPNDMYMQSISSGEGASFTSANLSGGNVSNDGVAVSMRNGSFSLRTRARHASSLTPNNPIASSPNNLPSLQGGDGGRLSSSGSLIGHMTSNAEFHSFGGGSNMAMGSYTSSSNNLIASSPAIGSYSQLPIAYNLITSSPNNLIAYSPSNGEVQVAAEQALMSASSSANGLFGGMMTSYGTASYDQTIYGSYGSTPSGIRGRQNATPGVGQTWLNWLAMYGGSYGSYDSETGTWYYDTYQLRKAYDAFCATWNESMGKKPTWDEWLAWFMASEGDGNGFDWSDGDKNWTYQFVPVGNILPLVLMAILYMIILFVKRNKTAQL